MIRSPLEACKGRKKETVATWLVVCFALLLPTAFSWVYVATEEAAHEWLAHYDPVVYLRTGLSDAGVQALQREIEDWTPVGTVTVRTREEAYRDLSSRLGDKEFAALGLTAESMPVSLLIEPRLPVVGHVELVSRLEGLDARLEVEAVDVPASTPLYLLQALGSSVYLILFLALVLWIKAAISLHNYLRLLEQDERELWEVLWIFGADDNARRIPTWTRGIVVGGSAGVGAAVLSIVVISLWDAIREQFLTSVDMTSGWWLAGLPVVLGLVLGLMTATVSTGRRGMSPISEGVSP